MHQQLSITKALNINKQQQQKNKSIVFFSGRTATNIFSLFRINGLTGWFVFPTSSKLGERQVRILSHALTLHDWSVHLVMSPGPCATISHLSDAPPSLIGSNE